MNKDKTKNHKGTKNLRPDNRVKFSKENQPSPEAKSAGHTKARLLRNLKQDMFDKLTGMGTIDSGMAKIDSKVKEGDVKELIDVIRIIAPKEMDITTDGEAINIIVTGINRKGDENEAAK